MWASHLVIHGVPSARRLGGPGECDCLTVLPARSPARAGALARTTSGSCGPGGRTSCQGRSRRTMCRWIRICCTVSHLPGQPPIPWGRWRQPGPIGPALREQYGLPPARGVTRRCRPGGISLCGDPSPEGATEPAGGGIRGSGPAADPGGGLGSVGRAELAQDVGHVFCPCRAPPSGRGRCAGWTCPRRTAAARGRSAARQDGGSPPQHHGGGERRADRYDDGGAASWLPDLLTLPVPMPQNEMVPEPATVISCARNAPGLGWHGLASTSFSVRVTGKLPRIPR
jgi:hypothetical protein